MALPTEYARLPFDNLYKFMSIAGIVLIVTALYGAVWLDDETRKLAIQVTAEIVQPLLCKSGLD